MAFSKSPFKRFNELQSTDTVPVGTYDPKYMTDLGIIAQPKCSGGNIAQGSGRVSRSSSIERSSRRHPSPAGRRESSTRINDRTRPLSAIHISSLKDTSELQEKLKEAEQRCEDALAKVKSLEEERNSFQSKLETLESEKNEIDPALAIQLSELTSAMAEVNRELAETKAELEASKVTSELKEREWTLSSNKMKKNLQEMEDVLESRQEREKQMSNQNQALVKQNEALELDRVQVNKALEETDKKLNAIEAQLEAELTRLRGSEVKCSSLESKMEGCYQAWHDELSGAHKEKSELAVQVDALTKDIAQFQEEIQSFQKQLQDDKMTEDKNKAKLDKTAAEMTGYLDQLDLAREEIGILKKQLEHETTQREAAETHYEEAVKSVMNAHSSLGTMRMDWCKREKEYLSDIEKLRNRLKQFVESPTDLMNQELKTTMTELILQQETSHDLRRKIHEMEESITKQRMDLENELENGRNRMIEVDPEAELESLLDIEEDEGLLVTDDDDEIDAWKASVAVSKKETGKSDATGKTTTRKTYDNNGNPLRPNGVTSSSVADDYANQNNGKNSAQPQSHVNAKGTPLVGGGGGGGSMITTEKWTKSEIGERERSVTEGQNRLYAIAEDEEEGPASSVSK